MRISRVAPFLFSFFAASLAQSSCSASGHSGQVVKTSGNKTGKIGDVNYEIWADGGNNTADFYSDGSMYCTFNNSKDFLCRSGINISPPKLPSEIGHITAEFKVEKKSVQNVGYSYVGVYGWTTSSGISGVFEFYIVDNWLSAGRPGDWVGNQKFGNFNIDGGEYTVYKNTKGDLVQYFSLRTSARTCGTIDVTAHFEKWASLGLKMPKITEIKVLAEAGTTNGGCSGSVDFPYAKITIGGSSQGNNNQGNNNQGNYNQGNYNQGNYNQGNNNNNQPPQNATPSNGNSGNCAGEWAQCGGSGFNGPTCCKSGKCVKINDYYSQCQQ